MRKRGGSRAEQRTSTSLSTNGVGAFRI